MVEHFLVTGAQGCIGAWVLKNLIQEGTEVTVLDVDKNVRRLALIATADEIARVNFVQGDVADASAVLRLVKNLGITHIVHLAGLQTPACQADPIAGARVNVIGTLSVFEAARHLPDQVRRIVYASSAAIFGQEESYHTPVRDDAPPTPISQYGVFKQANEGSARVYWRQHHIASIGLRPLTVYGVGRDQGMTSAPTKAMKAAVVGRPYTIPFTGCTDMLYVDDCAKAFIHCARVPFEGADAFNLSGELAEITDVIRRIEEVLPHSRGALHASGGTIPIYPFLDDSRLRALGPLPRTSLRAGIELTIQQFQELQRTGRLETADFET
jgi:nucleoside-diphosphate-sugar epimerase